MSETTAAPAPTEADAPAAAPDASAAPAEATQATEAAQQPAAEPEQTEPPKPRQGDRRFAQITARLNAEAAARERAERELAAAKALLEAGKPPEERTSPAAETVEQAAQRLVAEREFASRRAAVVAAGEKEFGADDWNEKTGILHGLGATANPGFMQALLELPNAPKVVAHYAEDADALAALLSKFPVALATEMGRVAAALDRPVVRPQSKAPRPVAPVTATAVVPEPTPYDEGLSMRDYVELRRKTAPYKLGGQRRA